MKHLVLLLLLPLLSLADDFARVTLSGRVNWTYTPPACETISQVNDDAANGGGNAASSPTLAARMGTRLYATNSMSVCKVEVYIFAASSETCDFNVEVYSDSSNTVGTLLATSDTVGGAGVGAGSGAVSWVEFTMPTSVSLTSGSYYWVVIHRTSPTVGMTWLYNNTTPEHIVSGDVGSWSDVSTSRGARYRLYE